ncbi:ABC transporter substrate-binding protein [Castellaniella sp.]|uniref:ABC transporter substrate-binding protein n=1 Tax=Castellaniella sp. TaxID=1955812 RepID=UPI003569B717
MKRFSQLLIAAAFSTAAFAPVHAADIKIGVGQALTGGGALYGKAIVNGFEMAVDEINQAGGLHGNAIKLVMEDTKSEKGAAINAYKRLIFGDKVLAIFGTTVSNTAQAADPTAQAAKTVALSSSNTAYDITSIGDYIFRNAVIEADVLPVTVAVAKEKLSLKKVAILYGNDDDFTVDEYDIFKETLTEQGIEITTEETFVKGDVDFKAQLTKIKSTDPDAIVIAALAEGGPIMVQARQLGIDLPFIGGNGMNSDKIFTTAPGVASNDLWVGSPWSLDNDTPENKQFIADYNARYKVNPDQFAAQAYDAAHILAQAIRGIQLSGDVAADRAALRDALPNVTWTGATGPFKFKRHLDRQGQPTGYDADQTAIVSVTRDGRFVLVD